MFALPLAAGFGGTQTPYDLLIATNENGAGDGIVHEEFPSPAFTEGGGRFEMVQLWVNLRAADKTAPASYQSIRAADIPRLDLADGAGSLNVIAGDYVGTGGPAHTFGPINVWDLRLNRDGATTLTVPEGHTAMVVVLSGTVQINGGKIARDAELALFDRAGAEIALAANNDAKLLILTGEPIDEPVVGHGPFVMNSAEEIEESILGFRSGRLGKAV